jgi:hypothetical protein
MIRAMAQVNHLAIVPLLVLSAAFVGCGGSVGNRVSGKVTFKGQPVPAGKVYITPDTTKGNSGPTGFADIQNGAYDTSAAGGQGGPTGAVIFKVEGFDPNPPPGAEPDVTSTLLFHGYEMTADLSGADVVQDIEVPDTAAGGPPQPAQMIEP